MCARRITVALGLVVVTVLVPCASARATPWIIWMVSVEWTGKVCYNVESPLPGLIPLWVPPGGWWYEIKAEWYTSVWEPLDTDLYCDGELAVAHVSPYEYHCGYDPLYGYSCQCNYRAFDWVPEGRHCYSAWWGPYYSNEICVEVP